MVVKSSKLFMLAMKMAPAHQKLIAIVWKKNDQVQLYEADNVPDDRKFKCMELNQLI